ncbi:MAG: hypothetical protein K8S62_15845 [Candidatus Sabulitectum sp.]|nr:hypothetical protein [Candidatus Sabulitectum sp.]
MKQAVPGKRKVDIGTMVQALVLDTLSGRSPLYMMKDFIKEQNCESKTASNWERPER